MEDALLQIVEPFGRERGRRREVRLLELALQLGRVLLDLLAGSLLEEDVIDVGVAFVEAETAQGFCEIGCHDFVADLGSDDPA
jgi:hypothetical protein